MSSVLKDWAMELPLRHQGVLLGAVRGCDLTPKNPQDSSERQLVAYLRWIVFNPADEREVGIPGAYMQSEPPLHWKPSEFGHYPQHWYAHLMHAYQIVGYCHPDSSIGINGMIIYKRFVNGLHLNIETDLQMYRRLTEDRVANGTVVS